MMKLIIALSLVGLNFIPSVAGGEEYLGSAGHRLRGSSISGSEEGEVDLFKGSSGGSSSSEDISVPQAHTAVARGNSWPGEFPMAPEVLAAGLLPAPSVVPQERPMTGPFFAAEAAGEEEDTAPPLRNASALWHLPTPLFLPTPVPLPAGEAVPPALVSSAVMEEREKGKRVYRKRRDRVTVEERRERLRIWSAQQRSKRKEKLVELNDWAKTDPVLREKLQAITNHEMPEQMDIKKIQQKLRSERDIARKKLEGKGRYANAEEMQSLRQKIESLEQRIEQKTNRMPRVGRMLRLALYKEEAAKRSGSLQKEEDFFHVSPVPQGGPVGILEAAGEAEVPMEEDSVTPERTPLEQAFNASFALSRAAAPHEEEDLQSLSVGSISSGVRKVPNRKGETFAERQQNRKRINKECVARRRAVQDAHYTQLELWAKTDPVLKEKMQQIKSRQMPEQLALISGREEVKDRREKVENELDRATMNDREKVDSPLVDSLRGRKEELQKRFRNDGYKLTRKTKELYEDLYQEEAQKRPSSLALRPKE